MVDTDGSGDIDKKEFEAAIKAHGGLGQKTRKMFAQVTKGGPPTWEEVLEELDEDGSGTVSWPELLNFLKQIAKEHDYKLTKDDIEQVHEMFKMVDADGSGDVDKAEFEAAVKAHGGLNQKTRKMFAQIKKGGPPTWEEVLEELDEDGSGTVSWDELLNFLKEIAKEHDYKLTKKDIEQVHEMFKMVDTDGSGDVDKAEFEAAVKAHGGLNQKARKMFAQIKNGSSKGGAPSWEDVLEVLDEDGSGTVSWDEIVSFIKQVEKEHGVKISKEDKKAIKAAFEQVDADGSGDIDKKEFEAAVAAMEGLAALRKYM